MKGLTMLASSISSSSVWPSYHQHHRHRHRHHHSFVLPLRRLQYQLVPAVIGLIVVTAATASAAVGGTRAAVTTTAATTTSAFISSSTSRMTFAGCRRRGAVAGIGTSTCTCTGTSPAVAWKFHHSRPIPTATTTTIAASRYGSTGHSFVPVGTQLPARRDIPSSSALRLFSSSTDDNDDDDDDATTSTTTTHKCLLPNVMRFRGNVATGYGRGGKKLGVPTANLPSSLFQDALSNVQTGVYFGYASIERNYNEQDDDDMVIHKAVVNVGYSPTFEGQENKEKIIEAHLIVPSSSSSEENETKKISDPPPPQQPLLDDFYDVPMKLQLIGYLRSEQKFDSFDQLIQQIHTDINNARTYLDTIPLYTMCQQDPFFGVTSSSSSSSLSQSQPPWIGSSGGNDVASWEVQSMLSFLRDLQEQQQQQ